MGNIVEIEPRQPGTNQSAVGAIVHVNMPTVTRSVQVGGGHASGRSGFLAGVGNGPRSASGGRTEIGARPTASSPTTGHRRAWRQAAKYWYPPEG